MLVTTQPKASNPLIKNAVAKVRAFLVIVGLESYMLQSKHCEVQVHQLLVENFHDARFGEPQTDDLPFEPTSLSLNLAESAFLLSGPKGVLIGEMPGALMNHINHSEQSLEQPKTDVPIICTEFLEGSRLEVI